MKVIWKSISTKAPNSIEEAFDILLKNRKVKHIDEFINPVSPINFSLKDVSIDENQVLKAKNRILSAKEKQEDVVIFGDYDADGVSATAIMWEALNSIGLNVYPFIPERISQGYGLNFDVYESLIKKYQNLKLIITVDNGIVAHQDIEKFQKKGIDVIVTDHHKKDKTKNKAYALVHSEQICGAGVAWFFAKEILKNQKSNFDVFQVLELVLIGTIADQMELVNVNRNFVVHGLKAINNTKRIGLLSLLQLSEKEIFEINERDIGFFIAPKINAMGRIAHAMDALRLLCTKDKKRAKDLSKLVYETNSKRQNILVESTQLALNIANEKTFENLVFVYHESFHEGVLGLIASKLVEEFSLPSIAISISDRYAKGSMRVPDDRFDAVSALRKIEEKMIAGGGHKGAAGFTILEKDLKEVEEIISNEFKNQILDKNEIDLNYEFEIKSNLISFEFYKKILKLKPFGNGNLEPVFYSSFEVVTKNLVGGDKHLKMKLKNNDNVIDAIYFNKGNLYAHLQINQKIEALFSLNVNSWNNREYLQLLIKDIK